MSHLEDAGVYSDLSFEQQQLVLGTLRSVLDSPYFSKSKRYPALLEFAVRAALEDGSNPVKERTVGVQVFGRPANYDTGNDSVVRIAAGEVRRRTAAYFSEHSEAPVRIDIPVGCYKAEFHFRSGPVPEAAVPEQQPQTLIDASSEPLQTATREVRLSQASLPLTSSEQEIPRYQRSARLRVQVALAATLLVIVAGVAWWSHLQNRARQDFWWPVLHTDQPALILVGKTDMPAPAVAEAGQTQATASVSAAPTNLVLPDAIVTAQVCKVFGEYGRDCIIAPAAVARAEEIRGRSVVTVGGFNNPWTQRLLAPLRYQIQFDTLAEPASERTRLVVEHKPTADIPLGRIASGNDPPADFTKDYAIVARYRSDITEGMVVVVAGLGIPGTTGAGQYVSSPERMNQILSRAPKDWKGVNFEAVLQIDVVQGSPGRVEVIASTFW